MSSIKYRGGRDGTLGGAAGGVLFCPECGGRGYLVVEWSTENEHGQECVDCDSCDGSGRCLASSLECNVCGSFPVRAGLLTMTSRAGDQCPCCYLDNHDCDGVLQKAGHERRSQISNTRRRPRRLGAR